MTQEVAKNRYPRKKKVSSTCGYDQGHCRFYNLEPPLNHPLCSCPKRFVSFNILCLASRVSCLKSPLSFYLSRIVSRALYLVPRVSCPRSPVYCPVSRTAPALRAVSRQWCPVCFVSRVSSLVSSVSYLLSKAPYLVYIWCLASCVSYLLAPISGLLSNVLCLVSPVLCPVAPCLRRVSRVLCLVWVLLS